MALLNVAECAGLLRVTSETVRRLAHDGAIPAVRVGKQMRFDRAEVLEMLRKRGLWPSPAEAAARREASRTREIAELERRRGTSATQGGAGDGK